MIRRPLKNSLAFPTRIGSADECSVAGATKGYDAEASRAQLSAFFRTGTCLLRKPSSVKGLVVWQIYVPEQQRQMISTRSMIGISDGSHVEWIRIKTVVRYTLPKPYMILFTRLFGERDSFVELLTSGQNAALDGYTALSSRPVETVRTFPPNFLDFFSELFFDSDHIYVSDKNASLDGFMASLSHLAAANAARSLPPEALVQRFVEAKSLVGRFNEKMVVEALSDQGAASTDMAIKYLLDHPDEFAISHCGAPQKLAVFDAQTLRRSAQKIVDFYNNAPSSRANCAWQAVLARLGA